MKSDFDDLCDMRSEIVKKEHDLIMSIRPHSRAVAGYEHLPLIYAGLIFGLSMSPGATLSLLDIDIKAPVI